MGKDWTLDTYVLYEVADVNLAACTLILMILRQRHRVTFDHEGHIQAQYWRCIKKTRGKPGNELLRKWLGEAVAKLGQRLSGQLETRHQKALSNLRFHADDWPFVAVCSKSASKRLVAEESDYTQEIRAYLRSEMAVHVLSIQAAVDTRDP